MMGLDRLLVTVLGLGLIVAVNLYFFARPPGGAGRPGRGSCEPGKRSGRAGESGLLPAGRD